MVKQIQQRYVYKINSIRLRKANWNLILTIDEAIKNKELIALAESQVISFIDEFNNTSSLQIFEKAKQIQQQIKNIKRLPTNIQNRKTIELLYKEKYQTLLVNDYVSIVCENKKDFNRINAKKAFFINGIKFRHLVGTTGGVKKYTVVFVSERVHDFLQNRIDNGRDKTKKFIPAKLEAYQALVCSSSIPVSTPKGILVVDDCVTHFTDNVIKIDDAQDSDIPVVTYKKDYPITLIDSDGYGLLSPALSKRWAEELGEDYIPSGYCIRNSFCKGMVFTFDFHAYADSIANEYMVKDIWDNEVDIREVELVLTASMLKLWDSYKDINDYLDNCKKNNYTFRIAKYTPKTLENVRTTNYQFLQSLYLDDEDINKLIEPTVQEIKDILGYDYRKSILFLKGTHLDTMNFDTEIYDFTKALMIDKRMIEDPFVRHKIYNMIKKRITESKIGVLKVQGNYSIMSGDPYSLCQSIFGQKVTGLLKRGEFYSKYWNDLGIDKVACFRAPMSCHNNIRILNLKNTQETQDWYKYMNTVTIFNSWDTTAHALNGADKDGDAIFTTNNKVIIKAIRPTDTILCVQKTTEKKVPTKEDLLKSNKDGFGDDIGIITNHITSMTDILSKFSEDSAEYKELMKRIMCGQNYQQNAIDKIKGIVSKPMPKHWYKYSSDLDDFNKSIVANRKPYFFQYIYPHRMKEYNAYIKKSNRNCRFRYGMSINELIALENKTEEQNNYLKYYFLRMPLSVAPSVMNKICWSIEKEIDGLKLKYKDTKFDCSILKTNKQYSKGRFNAIKELYKDYRQKIQQQLQIFKLQKIDTEERKIHRQIFKEDFRNKAFALCSDTEELCNIVIDLCYKNSNDSKQFAWDICGDIIIENLLKNNNYKVSYPILDELGDIYFDGNSFSMVTVEVINEIDSE